MRRIRKTTLLIGFALVTALMALPSAAADHERSNDYQNYISGTDGFVIHCDPPVLKPQIGGVCFPLDGQEFMEAGIWVDDLGQARADETVRLVDALLGTNVHDVVGGEHVNGFWQIRNGGGNTIKSGAFCDGQFFINVPEGAAEMLVFLNGAVAGNPVLTTGDECPNLYEGATYGWVTLVKYHRHP